MHPEMWYSWLCIKQRQDIFIHPSYKGLALNLLLYINKSALHSKCCKYKKVTSHPSAQSFWPSHSWVGAAHPSPSWHWKMPGRHFRSVQTSPVGSSVPSAQSFSPSHLIIRCNINNFLDIAALITVKKHYHWCPASSYKLQKKYDYGKQPILLGCVVMQMLSKNRYIYPCE